MGEGSETVLFDQPDWKVPAGYLCYRCGYDLQGLTRPDRCPECGLSVDDSLKSDEIAFGMRRASWLGIFGVAFGVGYVALFLWQAANMISLLRARKNPSVDWVAPTLAGLGVCAHACVGLSHMMAASTLRMPHNRSLVDRLRIAAGAGIVAALISGVAAFTVGVMLQMALTACLTLIIGIRNSCFVSLVSRARGVRSPIILIVINGVTIAAALIQLLAHSVGASQVASCCSMIAAAGWMLFILFWPLLRAQVGKPKLRRLRE